MDSMTHVVVLRLHRERDLLYKEVMRGSERDCRDFMDNTDGVVTAHLPEGVEMATLAMGPIESWLAFKETSTGSVSARDGGELQ